MQSASNKVIQGGSNFGLWEKNRIMVREGMPMETREIKEVSRPVGWTGSLAQVASP